MIDTNVLIDVLASDQDWRDWSLEHLAGAQRDGIVEISAIVVGELAVRGPSYDELVAAFDDLAIPVRAFGAKAAHRAGRAQKLYRDNGGRRDRLIGDFLIGAHAIVAEAALLTRDPRPYRSYFPELTLITPESNP